MNGDTAKAMGLMAIDRNDSLCADGREARKMGLLGRIGAH